MRHRVPKEITGHFATRVNGAWHSHRTPTGAWTLAWPSRGLASTLVLARSGDSWEPVPRPDKRPGAVSGPSGARGPLPRVEFQVQPEELALLRAAAASESLPLAAWVRVVAVTTALKSAR